MTDKEIISGIRQQEEPAFKGLVDRYQQLVLNTCHSFLHNREDAEDIAQEVFIEAFRSIDSFRGDSRLSTWLYRISVNKSLNLIRKNKRTSLFSGLGSLFEGGSQEKLMPVSHEANPQEQLEEEDRARIMRMALDLLPEKQRIAFTLHRYEELSYKEVTDVMQLSLSSVESLLHRAKHNLKKYLEGYYNKVEKK